VRHGRQNTLADGLEARGKFGGRLVASAAGAWLAIEADGHGAVHEHLLVEHGDGVESGNCCLVLDDCHACLEEERGLIERVFLRLTRAETANNNNMVDGAKLTLHLWTHQN